MTDIDFLEGLCIKDIPLVKIYRAEMRDYPMNNRGRYHHGLLLTLAGSEKYSFRSKRIDTCPDTVLYIPKGESYQIDFEGEESSVICIDFELTEQTHHEPFIIGLAERSKAKDLFYEANTAFKKGLPGKDAATKASAYQIISSLIFEQSSREFSSYRKKLAPALDLLHTSYTDPDFSIEELAASIGVGRRYFEKLFLAEKGVPPRDYIIELKIRLAKELLQGEKLSVTSVAAEIGYADVYHFSKIFKQKTGKTPSEYKTKN